MHGLLLNLFSCNLILDDSNCCQYNLTSVKSIISVFRPKGLAIMYKTRFVLYPPFTDGKLHWHQMLRCLPIKRKKTAFYKSNLVVLDERLQVSQHDFIFSNHFRHRAARHAAFIIVCWLFFLLSYYIPTGVFPAWNTEKFAGNVARIGLLRWLWLRLFNSVVSFLPLLMDRHLPSYKRPPNRWNIVLQE